MEEFIAACLGGDLDAVKAAAPVRLTAGQLRGALRVVCGRGRLDVVEWFVAHFGVRECHMTAHDCKDTLDRLCKASVASAEERGETIEWLTGAFDLLDREDALAKLFESSVASAAPVEERVRTAQWLTDHFHLAEVLCVRAKRSLLVHACDSGQTEIVRWLVGALELGRADVVARRCGAFTDACRNGNLELVQWLAEEFNLTPANARGANRYNHTALTLAIVRGNVEIARWLFDKFGLNAADVRMAGVGCDPPLEIASWRGHVGVLRWIVDDVGVAVVEARLMFQAAHQGMSSAKLRNNEGCRAIVELLATKFGFTERDLPEN